MSRPRGAGIGVDLRFKEDISCSISIIPPRSMRGSFALDRGLLAILRLRPVTAKRESMRSIRAVG